MTFEDGIAAGALGLGRAVVDGGKCLTFCPRYARNLVQFSSVEDILANSQSEFWALELDGASEGRPGHWQERRLSLDAPGRDGALQAGASNYSRDHHAVSCGMCQAGARVFVLPPIPQFLSVPPPGMPVF